MKKRLVVLFCLAFAAMSVLGACGKKSGGNGRSFDSIESDRLTEEEWIAAVDATCAADNVSVDMCFTIIEGAEKTESTESGSYRSVGNTKFVYNHKAVHENKEKKYPDLYATEQYEFVYDIENNVWVRRGIAHEGSVIIGVIESLTQDLRDKYSLFTYDEKQSAYVYSGMESEWEKTVARSKSIKFKDGKIAGIRTTYVFDSSEEKSEHVFYDYGKTKIDPLPTEWEERSDEWWEETEF